MTKLVWKGWQSINLGQFIELSERDSATDEEAVFDLCSVVFGEDVDFIKKAYPYEKLVSFASKAMETLSQEPEAKEVKRWKDYQLPDFVDRLDGSWWSNASFEQVQAIMLEMEGIEKAQQRNEGLSVKGWPLMFAVLFQKKGEVLTEEAIVDRERMFLEMPMNVAWGAFFLLKRWRRRTTRGLRLYLIALRIMLNWRNLVQRLARITRRKKQG